MQKDTLKLVDFNNAHITKSYLDRMVKEAVDEAVREGKEPTTLVKAKALEKFAKKLRKAIQPQALEKIKPLEKDKRTAYGVKLVPTKTAPKYSYEHNKKWKRLKEKEEKAKQERKKIEEKMKIDGKAKKESEPTEYVRVDIK